MSRENRMLVMYVAGIVILFTYFRYQYPNIGGGENLRQNPQAPLIRVLSETGLLPEVEKVSRSYELEFGVRVHLDSSERSVETSSDYDMWVASGDGSFPEQTDVVHSFFIPPWHSTARDQVDTPWRIGIRSVSEMRRVGAAKFARYLMASDRGLSIVSPDLKLNQSADPWDSEPAPTLIVWEGVFPFIQSAVKKFEQLEGASLRLIVGDCSLVDAKLRNNKEADGALILGGVCSDREVVEGWDALSLGTRSIVMLSSRQNPSLGIEGQWDTNRNVSIGSLEGLYPPLLEVINEGQVAPTLRDLLTTDSPSNYRRFRDLVGGVVNRPELIGLSIDWPLMELAEGITAAPVGKAEISLDLWVSEDSKYKHVLSRFAQMLAYIKRTEP